MTRADGVPAARERRAGAHDSDSTGRAPSGTAVQTVLGPVAPEALGITQCHEHLLIDLGRLVPGYDAILYDEGLAAEELRRFGAAAGTGCAVVELTCGGIGRNPAGLRRISAESGVHVVMGAGWYREAVYPTEVYERSTAQLADLLARDLLEGVPIAPPVEAAGAPAPNAVATSHGCGPGDQEASRADGAESGRVFAGVIGEIGTGRGSITPAEERVLRAAARAQRRTGAALFTHTTHFGELAHEQLALLAEEAVDPRRVVISHLGDRRGIGMLLPIAATGANLSIDNIGFREYQTDEQRADNVAALIAEGLVDQIVLSTDICQLSHLHAYGGKGYDHLLRTFVPLLRQRGVSDAHLRRMLVDNPRRILTMRSEQRARRER